MNESVWLIGNKGMLGSEVEKILQKESIPYVATDVECDITDPAELERFVVGKQLSWIINCSAYTAVDKAEDEEQKALSINADGVGNIGRVAESIGATVIHVSTDYVFSGQKNGAYTEQDEPNPVGAYGRTKAEGERRLMEATQRHFVIRTAWLYGKNGNNFVHTMLRLMKERDSINVVSDQWGTPTLADDLASLIVHIVSTASTKYGIYHFTNEGKTNWHGFASEIYRQAREVGLLTEGCKIYPISSNEYPAKAHRPANSVMSKEKVREQLHYFVAPWEAALNRFLKDSIHGTKAD